MADIDASGGGHAKKGGGKKRGKKLSTRVDFTPMVDLGFLLITFFMLTTSMNKPQAMEINMPDKTKIPEEEQTKVKESQAMTLLLTGKDQIVYYFGQNIESPLITDFSPNGIRKVLLEESRKRNPSYDSINVYRKQYQTRQISEETLRSNVSRIKNYKNGLIVLIKADDKSKYKNLVDILDEMTITNNGRYAIVDIAPGDLKMIEDNPYVKK